MKKKVIIVTFVLLSTAPLILGLAYSVLYSFGMIGLLNNGFTLEHWAKLFSSNSAWSSLWYSTWLTLVSLVLILALSLGVSSWLFFSNNKQGWIYKSLFVPLLIPPIIAAFSWFYLLSNSGIISRVAFHLKLIDSIDDFPRLVNDPYSLGILITHVFLVFPLFALLFVQQAKKLNMRALYQTSRTLGASKRQFFFRIYSSLLITHSQAIIALYAIFLMGTYEVPLILGRSSPRTVTLYITDQIERFDLTNIPVGHAMAVIYCIYVFLIARFFINKRQIQFI